MHEMHLVGSVLNVPRSGCALYEMQEWQRDELESSAQGQVLACYQQSLVHVLMHVCDPSLY